MKLKKIKQNSGTALVLAITLVTVISLMGLTLVSVTFSTFKTAITKSDQNSSYFAGEAGVQKIMSILDKKVGNLSEAAKKSASDYFDGVNFNLYRNPDGTYVSGYATTYNTKFLEYFNTEVDTYFTGINLAKQKDLLDTAGEEGGKAMAYVDTDAGTTKKVIIDHCTYDNVTNKLTVKVKSTYNSYPKTIQVVFVLQPYASYFKPTESMNTKAVSATRHVILQKAIVAERNLIANEGTITINGDVLAFGTVPKSGEAEDLTRDWDEFGGILIGMSDMWRSNFASFGISNEADLNNNSPATLTINGNAATMANIGVLYSEEEDVGTPTVDESTLTVDNGAFARNINAFEGADYSTINIEDAYVNDNLGIDADNAVMNIHDLYGVVEHGYDINGVIGDTDETGDTQSPKRTSSVVITGDSTLNLAHKFALADPPGETYIAGSGFFESLADSSGYPYVAGISGIKATAQLERAFQKDEESIVNGSGNTPIYWKADGGSDNPLAVYDNEGHAINWKNYDDDGFSFGMINGLDGNLNFSLERRAIHFREIWKNRWDGTAYDDYVAFGNIKGETNAGGDVVGYASGAVALRNQSDVDNIYAGTDAFSVTQANFRADVKKPSLRSFYDQIKGLVNEPYSASSPKLNYVEPNKHIDDIEYRDTSYVGAGMIVSDTPYSTSKGFVYFNSSGSDISIANDGGTWEINGKAIPELIDLPDDNPDKGMVMAGIIVVDGNLLIENGFEFTGIILCKKNVILKGSGTTEISYNDTVISDLLASDVVVNGFFGNLTYKLTDTSDSSYDLRKMSQRLQQKAVTIESMNEVD